MQGRRIGESGRTIGGFEVTNINNYYTLNWDFLNYRVLVHSDEVIEGMGAPPRFFSGSSI